MNQVQKYRGDMKFVKFFGVMVLVAAWNLCLAQLKFKLEKLNSLINSDVYDEISPVVTRDGQTLYFTRVAIPDFNRTLIQDNVDISKTLSEAEYFEMLKNVYSQIAGEQVLDPVLSQINQEIMVADTKLELFDRVYHPGFPLNNALPNSVCSLAPKDNGLIVINHFYTDGSTNKGFSFLDRKEDGSFTFPTPIYVNDFYSHSTDVNICMSYDGDIIILSLNRDQGYGDADLYACFKLKENLWSEPMNLGPQVNGPHREITPFISQDKTKLFFASNRPNGKGGTDIYVTDRLDYTWTNWTEPRLLPEPINSKYDDSNPVLVEPGSFVYFTSRRDGSSDIFRVRFEFKEKIENAITIKGNFINSITNEPLDGTLYYGLTKTRTADTYDTKPDGKFEIVIDKKGTYRLSPVKNGYIGKNQLIDLSIVSQSEINTYEIDFYLTPLGEDQKIDLKQIYFERGTPVVLPASFENLDKLSLIMNENPSIKIRIEGHTDSVGTVHELLELSRDRAESIKKYLVLNKNIGSNRIRTVGYGGSRPISSNNSEENRARNRRVEIYIESANLANKINFNDLPNPIVRPIYVHAENSLASSKKQLVINPGTNNKPIPAQRTFEENSVRYKNDVQKDDLTNFSMFGKISFNNNALSIKEYSFETIRSLVDYLKLNPTKNITVLGQASSLDEENNTFEFATKRAKGVKEYLVFKSVPSEQVIIGESKINADFAGVNVLIFN
ncbi:MAG: OmpA family protein [Saprospiraceae bacterium]